MKEDKLEHLLYTQWILKMRKGCERKQKKKEADNRKKLKDLFFIEYKICNVHDRESCPTCWVYGLGICPPIKESP